MQKLHEIKQREEEVVLQQFNEQLRQEREKQKIYFEMSKAAFEERVKRNEALIENFVDSPNSWKKLQTQIEKIQNKLDKAILSPPSVPIISPPAIPPVPPADAVTMDFSPSSFLSWTFGAIAVTGLVAWSLKSKENMAAASNIMQAAKAVLNYGKS